MSTSTATSKLTFTCECGGCRGIAKRYDSSYIEGIIQELEGHYFSPSTRRFFGTRLTGFYTLSGGGVLITSTQKAGFDSSAGREIGHAYFCRYGTLVTDIRFNTKVQARKGLFTLADKLDYCACHGCKIDRAGR
jgi:hypothetical protein